MLPAEESQNERLASLRRLDSVYLSQMFLHRTFHSLAFNIYWPTKWCHWPSHRSGNLIPFLPPDDKRLSDNERKKIHWDNNHGYKRLNLNFSSTQGDNGFHSETIIWWERLKCCHLLTHTKTTLVGTTKMDAKQKARQLPRIPSALDIIYCVMDFVWRRLEGTHDALTQDLGKQRNNQTSSKVGK